MDIIEIHNKIVFFVMNKLTVVTEHNIQNNNFNSYQEWYTFCIEKLEKLKELSKTDKNHYDYVMEILYPIYPILYTFSDDIYNLYEELLSLL